MGSTISQTGSSLRNYQAYYALFLLALLLIIIVLLWHSNREASITTFFGFIFGYILQRSRFCFAAGFRDIFMIRNTALTRAILLLLLLTSLGFFLVHLSGASYLPDFGIIYPVGIHTVVGGVLFGFGLVIAGNCVSGCLMRMGEGYLMQWVTFSGLLIGSALGAWNLGWWGPRFIEFSSEVFIPDYMGWPASLIIYILLLALLYFFALAFERGTYRVGAHFKLHSGFIINSMSNLSNMFFRGKNWSYLTGAVALSLASILLFYFWGRPAGITSGLTHLAGWLSCRFGFAPCNWYYFQELIYLEGRRIYLEHPLLYLSAGIVIGSLFASLIHSEFRIRRIKSFRFTMSALSGGILLGYSSRIAMGCNFGGFWGGLSSFSLHGWVFGLFILVGAYLGGKFFMRYLL